MRKVAIITLITLFLLSSCNGKDELENLNDMSFGDDDYKVLVSPNNHLAFKLLEHGELNDEDNIFISPTSLFIALSMVYNGADGEAEKELAQALQIERMDKQELNKANASLIAKLTEQSDEIELLFANSIWLNERFHFQEQFKKDNNHYFNADVNEVNIADPDTADLINMWISENTNEKIKEIVQPPLKDDLVTILINALYFSGDWKYEFDETLTKAYPFTNSNGESKDVLLMTLQEELPYIENDVFQAVSIPYYDDKMSMDIYLPRENVTLTDLKDEILSGRWENWNRQFETEEGTVLLPKFELEYEASLNKTLQDLGMSTVFTKDAEFPHMIVEDNPVWISKVRQKTYIDVHEKGTEAAAATSVELETLSLVDDTPFYMEVNRPFFFIIKDSETNLILFTGFIENPV